MIGPTAAAAAQLVGGLIGGGQRDRRAMRQLRELQDAADFVFDRAVEDQARARSYRDEDEARLRANQGVNLKKLRDDAIAAGFNPLTVLENTGGAGYDMQTSVLTSPFVSYSDAARTRVDARLGAMPTVVSTAGYLGDSIAGAGDAFFRQLNEETRLGLESARNDIYAAEVAGSMTRGPFGAPVTQKDMAPKRVQQTRQNYGPDFIGPMPVVPVQTASGWIDLPWNVAKVLRKEPGDSFVGEDWEALQGDFLSEGQNILENLWGTLAQGGGGSGFGPIVKPHTSRAAPGAASQPLQIDIWPTDSP